MYFPTSSSQSLLVINNHEKQQPRIFNMKKIQLGGHRYKTVPIQGYTIVDDEDYEWALQYQWHLSQYGYVARMGGRDVDSNRKLLFMHRELINVPKGILTDHINRDKLDNRKKNLRTCNHAQNAWNAERRKDNKSGYKGVSWNKRTMRWIPQLQVNKRSIYLGVFKKKQIAIEAYKQAVKKYFKEFSPYEKKQQSRIFGAHL
ncbi:hypothetical protein LCGC14_2133640 [marine sediment metagenome]|uniref:HNH nuclease domain-containing protein n=1 Tax=marine sediment metagenome TaxID=412755 RepID=A0A0F9GDN0_9ZZZZ